MLKSTLRTILFGASFLAAGSLQATVIFDSNSTVSDPTESNTSGFNIVIAKNPAWANPLPGSNWISFENTGDPSSPGFVTVPNGTVVAFYQNFTLTAAGASVNGTVSVLADDSTSVILNGHTLVTEASFIGNGYSTCSDTVPNCVTADTVVLPSADLVTGVNVLEFDTAQRAGSSFGLDYAGSAGSAPEPSTMVLMGTVLLGVATWGRRRLTASK